MIFNKTSIVVCIYAKGKRDFKFILFCIIPQLINKCYGLLKKIKYIEL